MELADWWMMDSRAVVLMHYDSGGHFTGAEIAPPAETARYLAARDAAWDAAEPFTTWWDAHPQYHRHISVARAEKDGMARGDFLSRKLTDLRRQAGLSQEAAAEAAQIGPGGAGQVRLSRIETGAHPPTEDEVRRLCTLYRAPRAVRDNCLLWAARDTDASAISARKILGHASEYQAQLGSLEEACRQARYWQPLLIPGLLQVEGYARAVFSDRLPGAAAERSVAARLRRQHILASDREFAFVVAEGALRWSAGPEVMREQLAHLAEAAGQYRVGVIPQARTVTTFPVHGFALFDDDQVVIGLRHATELVGDREAVAEYVAWFAELEALAVFGEEARQVIEDVAASYRIVGNG